LREVPVTDKKQPTRDRYGKINGAAGQSKSGSPYYHHTGPDVAVEIASPRLVPPKAPHHRRIGDGECLAVRAFDFGSCPQWHRNPSILWGAVCQGRWGAGGRIRGRRHSLPR
jgi:hypothetical protein